MSIARIALRIAAVEALKGRTLVGDNVLDSRIGALETDADGAARTDQEKPFIAVYTDGGKFNSRSDDLRGLVENGVTELLFEMGVTAAMADTNEKGESTIIGVGIPATDHSFEFTLDLLARQISDALTDPSNGWAEIFRGLSYRFVSIERARTGNIMDGVRLAGQQIKIALDLASDPVRGEVIDAGSPFSRLLERMEGSNEALLVKQAELIRLQIAGDGPEWEMVQRRHGMTAGELLALGLGPLAADTGRVAPAMDVGTIEFDGAVHEVPGDG